MWEQLFTAALSNGLWCALFVSLFIYQIADSKKRESKYIRTIEVLTQKGIDIKEMSKDISEIKSEVKNFNRTEEKNEFKIET